MVVHSAAFTAVRVLEILVALPVIGMLGWFVHPYVDNKLMVPDRLLAFFIISILACAWAIITFWQFRRYRNVSGPFIALVDLAFVGALMAMVIIFRGISDSDCGDLNVPVGVQFGDNSYSGGSSWGYKLNKPCAMFKASWALAIIDIILFFITAVLSFTMYRSNRYGTHTHHEKAVGRRSGSTSTYSSHRHARRTYV